MWDCFIGTVHGVKHARIELVSVYYFILEGRTVHVQMLLCTRNNEKMDKKSTAGAISRVHMCGSVPNLKCLEASRGITPPSTL